MNSEERERFIRFAYYSQMAANLMKEEPIAMLVDHHYHDPRDVLREISEWCYAQANPK